jgi:hypothetical protein
MSGVGPGRPPKAYRFRKGTSWESEGSTEIPASLLDFGF